MDKQQYIPPQLEGVKNEWMSAATMDKLFLFMDSKGGFSKPSTLCYKFEWEAKKKPHACTAGYVRRWCLKHVLVRAKARGFSPFISETGDKSGVQFSVKDIRELHKIKTDYRHLNSEILRLQQSEAASKMSIARLEQENASLRTKLLAALHAGPVDDRPGLYFMCDDEQILYVGMSDTSVRARVNGRANLVKSCRMISVPRARIRKEEREWIQLLNPPGNKSHRTDI